MMVLIALRAWRLSEAMTEIKLMIVESLFVVVTSHKKCFVSTLASCQRHETHRQVQLTPYKRDSAQCGEKDRRSVVTGMRGQSRHLGEMRQSVLEKVLLLDLNAVLDKELSVLLGECHVTMVLLLLGDVPYDHVSIAQIV